MIDIDSFDYEGGKPYVYFWYKGIAMDAGLVFMEFGKPVVIKGTAQGCEVDINFDEYEELQREVTLFWIASRVLEQQLLLAKKTTAKQCAWN